MSNPWITYSDLPNFQPTVVEMAQSYHRTKTTIDDPNTRIDDIEREFYLNSPQAETTIYQNQGGWLYDEKNPLHIDKIEAELEAEPLVLTEFGRTRTPDSPPDLSLSLDKDGSITTPKVVFVDIDYLPGWDPTNYPIEDSYYRSLKNFVNDQMDQTIVLDDKTSFIMPGMNGYSYLVVDAPMYFPSQYQIEVKTPEGKSILINLSNAYPTVLDIDGNESPNNSIKSMTISGDGTRLRVVGLGVDNVTNRPDLITIETHRINDPTGTIQAPDTIEGKYVATQTIEVDGKKYEVLFIVDRQQTHTAITTHVRLLDNTTSTQPTSPLLPMLTLPAPLAGNPTPGLR
jgi:hypothetical protein